MYGPVADRLTRASAARGACVALHSCRYVEAAQALSILCAHNAGERHPAVPEALIRFVDQSRAHLKAIAEVHGSAALTWELRLVKATYEQAQLCQL
jgi:hypothetical protein